MRSKKQTYNALLGTVFLLFIYLSSNGQIIINPTAPSEDDAIVKIESNGGGVLIPRMTTAERNLIAGVEGLMVYDIETASFWFYNGIEWSELKKKTDFDITQLVDADGDTKIETNSASDRINSDIAGSNKFSFRINANDNVMTHVTDASVFVGYEAGLAATTGNYNVFYGYRSGLNNTTGSRNIFFGKESGNMMMGGSDNVFLGNLAGLSITSGVGNIFLGQQAGRGNTGGSNNVFIGYNSGNTSSASGNVFIGANSGNGEIRSNRLEIKVNNNIVISGDFQNDELEFHYPMAFVPPTDNVGIQTNGNWISSDGDNEGIFIDTVGRVGFGTSGPLARSAEVGGDFRINGVASGNATFLTYSDKNITPTAFAKRTKFGSFRVNGGNGTKSNHYTSTDFVSVSKPSTGVYQFTFNASFTSTPILVAMAGGSAKVIIQSISSTGAVVETRDNNGNLVNADIMAHVIGEY